MTWAQVLRGHPLVSSIFLLLPGVGSTNDRMMRLLEKLQNDRASVDDLFARQRQLTRAELTEILKARIIRRLQ